MIRFLMALFGREYETCKSCMALKDQLDFERRRSEELVGVLTTLLKPQPAVLTNQDNLQPIKSGVTLWSRKRAELEKADRLAAGIKNTSPVIAKADDEVSKLESELGVG